MHYIRGQNNVVADCLSRPICGINVDAFDLSGIASKQVDDPELSEYRDRLTMYTLPSNLPLFCDVSTNVPRPYVPKLLRVSIIKSLHNLTHPGCKATCQLGEQRYF